MSSSETRGKKLQKIFTSHSGFGFKLSYPQLATLIYLAFHTSFSPSPVAVSQLPSLANFTCLWKFLANLVPIPASLNFLG
jgi:hypothetical protein